MAAALLFIVNSHNICVCEWLPLWRSRSRRTRSWNPACEQQHGPTNDDGNKIAFVDIVDDDAVSLTVVVVYILCACVCHPPLTDFGQFGWFHLVDGVLFLLLWLYKCVLLLLLLLSLGVVVVLRSERWLSAVAF